MPAQALCTRSSFHRDKLQTLTLPSSKFVMTYFRIPFSDHPIKLERLHCGGALVSACCFVQDLECVYSQISSMAIFLFGSSFSFTGFSAIPICTRNKIGMHRENGVGLLLFGQFKSIQLHFGQSKTSSRMCL